MRLRTLACTLLFGLALAAAPALDYDPAVVLPSGARALSLDVCPVPRGFWEPLEAKGWVSRCFLAHGDPVVLEKALELALEKAGYARIERDEQRLTQQDRFVLERWRATEHELFVEHFLFPARQVAVYLIAHPPH